jgi:hypothetical protein
MKMVPSGQRQKMFEDWEKKVERRGVNAFEASNPSLAWSVIQHLVIHIRGTVVACLYYGI